MRKLFDSYLSHYKFSYFRHDLMAALVVTAIAIPESLGFAAIVGLPPVTGLYSALLGPIVYGLVAASRRLVVGADSATAALIASGAVLVAQADTAGYANAIAIIGLLTAAILMLMGLFRLGFLADLISRPVMVGFLAGVGVQLMITKLPEMLGIEAHGSLLQRLVTVMQHLPSINGMTVTIAILVVGVIIITKKTPIPGELLGLVLATLFVAMFHVADGYGVKLVGMLPSGLPSFAHPSLSLGMLATLFPTALSIALVIVAQSSTVIRSLGSEHDDKVRLNRDLFALGIGNAASALTHGFAINGSPPRSIAADIAGGKTAMTNVIMALLIGAVLLFGTSILAVVPMAALAAIIFMLGVHLIRVNELLYIWQTHRLEFVVAMVALVGTALFGVRQGVFIAVIVSLMERLSRQYHPKDDILLRDGKLSRWAEERLGEPTRHSHHPTGVLVYAFDGSLFFENINYFVTRVRQAIDRAEKPVTQLIIDAGAIDSIDYTAVETLKTLYRQLSADEVKLSFAHVSPNLRNQFDDYGVTELVGNGNIFSTLSSAMKAQPHDRHSVAEMIAKLRIAHDDYVVIGGAVMELLNLRDTTDIDLVVSDETFRRFRDQKHWHEYVQDDGKQILSSHGYTMMQSWMGNSFKHLKSRAVDIDGVACIDIDTLIDAKQHLGRKKDLADIKLLEQYRRDHPTATPPEASS